MKRKEIAFSILRVAAALLLAFLVSQIRLDFWESALYDGRVRLRPAPPLTGHVEVVLIDLPTVQSLSGLPDFVGHADFLRKLSSARPRAIVYDLDLRRFKGSDEGLQDFISTAKRLPELVFLTDDLELKGEAPLRFDPPFQDLPIAPGPKSVDSSNFAKDGVTRRFLIRYQDQDSAHVRLARLFRPQLGLEEPIRGQFEFLEAQQAFINFRPPGRASITSFAEALKPENLERFRGKIVIVGENTQIDPRDYARTPYARSSAEMTSAETHANILETLLRNDSPVRAPNWFDAFWVAIISILTVYVVFAVRPGTGLYILLSTMLLFTVVNTLTFWLAGFWFSLAHPLLAIFLCYYFLIPYRLIIENRHRWEIYEKHKILQQVEELKTNFISMMSHDLKTPIARIQGMTDVIESEPTPLTSTQREALDTIRASNQDLLKFINAILQYGRIEAQNIQLQRTPKDVNQILNLAIKQTEFLAKLKRIKIISELEPLFPISVDAELIRQVFSNLLENAVKYSPEDSKILVTSEEEDDFIVIQVADQGPGIPKDEISLLFMKFFRSRNAKASPIKGTGLGLYLSRYFTELHGGSISVESSYGQGTTFTVKLPLKEGGVHGEGARR